MLFVGALAVLMVGCTAKRGITDGNQRVDVSSMLSEAVDAAAPSDATQIYPRLVRGQGQNLNKLEIYSYPYDEVTRLEQRYGDVSRAAFLRDVFARAVKGHQDSDNAKWLAVINYFSRAMRHPPIEQPMYPDGTMVTDPLILMLLHEGRCGHQARVIVDMALANHYQARLVQLAAHLVAEVKWGDSWHWVDADAGFPVASLRSRFAELPSLDELARHPYVLDSLAARNWEWGESAQRTIDGIYLPGGIYYPGNLLTSSVYFGRQIFTGVFGGRTPTKQPAIIYMYKEGAPAQWQKDRYYGWDDLRKEVHTIPAVAVAYAPLPLRISGPQTVYADKKGDAVIPVRWVRTGWPACKPDQVRDCKMVFDRVAYEVRVSRNTRGWDYDFRDYDFMPRKGEGDISTTRNVRKIDGVTYGVDVSVRDLAEVFIEVDPIALDEARKDEFMWPSNELHVLIVPRAPRLGKLAAAAQ